VFRLFTFLVSVVGFAALVWFGVTVDLGNRTLFGHLRAIGQSDEAQQLWSGTKDKVTDFVGIEAARRAEAAKAAFKNPGIVDDKPAPAEADGAGKAPAVERAVPAEKAAPGQAVTRTAPPPVVYKPAPTVAKAKPAPAKSVAHAGKPAAHKPATKPAAHKPAATKPAAHDKTTGLRAQAHAPTSR
jgi:hypothetical protein